MLARGLLGETSLNGGGRSSMATNVCRWRMTKLEVDREKNQGREENKVECLRATKAFVFNQVPGRTLDWPREQGMDAHGRPHSNDRIGMLRHHDREKDRDLQGIIVKWILNALPVHGGHIGRIIPLDIGARRQQTHRWTGTRRGVMIEIGLAVREVGRWFLLVVWSWRIHLLVHDGETG